MSKFQTAQPAYIYTVSSCARAEYIYTACQKGLKLSGEYESDALDS